MNALRWLLFLCLPLLFLAGRPLAQEGIGSWYGPGFHGRKTASGERFNMNALTCAHRSLRFGTRIRVTNLRNKKSVVCRVNDRGPYIRGRIVDLSRAAAKNIDLSLGKVKVEVIR